MVAVFFTAGVEAINKALTYVKVSTRKSFVIFSDSMSVLQAIESQESKNPLVNRVLQACQEILCNGKFITFCWIPSHRDITGNEHADRAAKGAFLHILNCHVQMFLWRFGHLSHLCGRNGGIRSLVTNCTPSCPKLMRSITQDAQIENMKLLLIAFE